MNVMEPNDSDAWHMARALELAARGEGSVEPNPMVGCVIVRDGETVAEGYHRQFGGPHAEVEALRSAGARARGATAYVTLEPCCHHGKTPPCTQALIQAGIARVVVAQRDPFAKVAGQGIAELERAGIVVEVGLAKAEARRLNAPYLKRLATGRPWVVAKWAMTLDGKLATTIGDSRWISGEASREIVHRLRGRVDAVLVGRGTAAADDPLLTARPPGVRLASRIVVDSMAALSPSSQLVTTAREIPTIVACSPESPADRRQALSDAGCEVLLLGGTLANERLDALLADLGTRGMTNVLVEGGNQLLGSLFDLGQIDEVHAFIATKMIGGGEAPSPIGGAGRSLMAAALSLDQPTIGQSGPDVYVHGRVARSSASSKA